ncbi:hypothetical protein DPMN_026269 [Dreissena polymorpha]|uniref:Uncharacterized protein n=1 Tax=Dreissena polymorpha TaxID=45954 RepID=A0A9D4LRD1_DREPO|nr:hypothetical protein DPMN_026269 [Dreissena polymorpha]
MPQELWRSTKIVARHNVVPHWVLTDDEGQSPLKTKAKPDKDQSPLKAKVKADSQHLLVSEVGSVFKTTTDPVIRT